MQTCKILMGTKTNPVEVTGRCYYHGLFVHRGFGFRENKWFVTHRLSGYSISELFIADGFSTRKEARDFAKLLKEAVSNWDVPVKQLLKEFTKEKFSQVKKQMAEGKQ